MIVVFSKNNCPECAKATALLEVKGVPYTVEKVEDNENVRPFLLAMGHRSVPQIYKNSEDNSTEYKTYVGDYKTLKNFTDEQFDALK